MRRRSFLELLLAGSLAGKPLFAQEIVHPQPQRLLLTIAGIGAETDAAALGSVLATLVVGGVPVNLVLNGTGTMRPEAAISQLVMRYAGSFPGLVEILAWAPGLGSASPYEAARQAQAARQALSAALHPGDGQGAPMPLIQSVACKPPLQSPAASAALAAGFRTVLALPGAAPDMRAAPDATVDARLDRQGLLSLIGGEAVRIEDAAALLALPAPGLQRHIVLSAADLARLPMDRLVSAAQDLTRVLRAASLGLSSLTVLASDVQMRTEVTFHRRVALHVLGPAGETGGAGTETVAAVLDQLRKAGIPASHGPLPPDGGVGAATWWVPMDVPADPSFNPDLPFATSPEAALPLARPGTLAAQDLRFGVAVRPVADPRDAGLGSDAVLRVPILAHLGAGGSDAALPRLDAPGDGVVLISAAAFPTAALRSALVQALRAGVMQPSTRAMPLSGYCAEILPKDPLLPVLLLARSRRLRKSPGVGTVTAEERTALLEDARAAWSYFEVSTNRATGLCPATTILTSRPTAGHLAVSMWEAGSHLNALIAAVDLGVIPDDDFTARTAAVLRMVARGAQKRLALPPETIDAQSGKATTRFNSFDTARLLVAMHRLRGHRLAPKGLADMVANWTFGEVILNRRLHSYRERKLIDDFASNYADYAAAGMRLWGFDVASPMEAMAKVASADDEARVLATTVSFGVLGAEPCLLHLVEMPEAPVPAYLADCLDAIQSRLAEATGTPAAPSETPLDRSPWFTYQGFDLRNLADPWAVSAGPREIDAAATAAVRATSTKAAYLWHATRPGPQSAALITTLRAQARGKFGFDSALYLTSQMSTKGYSDLNTNAAILQSVAHILRGNG